jgi:hypothetical protein
VSQPSGTSATSRPRRRAAATSRRPDHVGHPARVSVPQGVGPAISANNRGMARLVGTTVNSVVGAGFNGARPPQHLRAVIERLD